MFSERISLKQLALVCRSLGTSLQAGIPVVKAFELAGRKSSDARVRGAMDDIVLRLQQGEDVHAALAAQGTRFPALMVDMVSVAEQSGALPEVLRSLSDHYDNTLRLRKDFIGQITIPVIQLLAAILLIAFLIFILGMIAASQGGEPLDVLGWGLTGTGGAIKWLIGWGMAFAGGFIGYQLITSSLQGKAFVHKLLMKVPIVGACLRDFAIARFSWAYHLTQEAGMPVAASLQESLQATANGAYMAASPHIIREVMAGADLSDALAGTDLFPEDFVHIVHVAETSGTVPEALQRMSPQFEDQARRSLKAMATALGWAIWAAVAGFIVFVIFSIALWYVGMLNDALKGL